MAIIVNHCCGRIYYFHMCVLQEIAPFETKGVMRASFSSRDADNHTAFIRIKTNASNEDEFIILPVEVEVTTGQLNELFLIPFDKIFLALTHVLCIFPAPGIYSSTEMLDFGTLRSQGVLFPTLHLVIVW